MRTRVDEGVWTVTREGDVHLGLLKGDIGAGWHGSFGTIPAASLPLVITTLNSGGFWSDSDLTLASGADGALITLQDQVVLRLAPEATARLQIVCSLVRAGHEPTSLAPPPVSQVFSTRGGLRVTDARGIGEPLGLGVVDAGLDGTVALLVPTTAGPLSLTLPALPVLVAAAEAGRISDHLQILVDSGDGPGLWVQVCAGATEQAAAEAQWLLPAFARRFGDRARER